MAANPIRPKGLDEEILLARYKENCDQARQHENLRERTTATIGVLLGFLGLKQDATLPHGPLVPIIAAFIILLGLFGIFASWLFDNRARMHRAAIKNILDQLGASAIRDAETKHVRFVWIWYTFHALLAVLGAVLLRFAWHDVETLLR